MVKSLSNLKKNKKALTKKVVNRNRNKKRNRTISKKKKLIRKRNKNRKGGGKDYREKCYVALLELLDNLEVNNPDDDYDKDNLLKYREITSSDFLYDKYRNLYGIYDQYSSENNNKSNNQSNKKERDIYYLRKLLDYLMRCVKEKNNESRWDQETHDGVYMPQIIEQINKVTH